MIIRIGSSIETFKEVELRRHLSILLAERHESSDETRTRNGSGKSSLVEIVNFILGGRIDQDSTFQAKELAKASFWADMVVDGIGLRVERSVASKDRVSVAFADGKSHGLDLEYDLLSSSGTTGVAEWCDWLGRRMFRLAPGRNVLGEEIAPPSFRSIIPFFLRRRQIGGFIRPHKSFEKQNDNEAQAALSWVFGLDWTLIREFAEHKEERKAINAIQRRAKGSGDDSLRTVAQLRSAVAVARAAADAARRDVSNMRVVGHYAELVNEASQLKEELELLAREATKLRSAIRHVEKSLEFEALPDGRAIESLYANAGKQLPDTVVKTFEQVRVFHESVVSNRRVHLGDELARSQARLSEVQASITDKGGRREEVLGQLQGAGAFSDLANLQTIQSARETSFLDLERRLAAALQAEADKADLRSTEASLLARLQNDLVGRTTAVDAAALAVNEALEKLYSDRYGALEVNASQNGPQFRVHIEGDRSGGISNMEIFCFDYALMKIATLRLGGPGILIHDSHLFADVDARQVATAIELGDRLAQALDVQYFVLMNSDEFAKLHFPKDYDPRHAILDVKIDDTDDGGLFGFKFG